MIYPYQAVWDQWRTLAQQWATVRGNLSVAEILATITEESSGNERAFNPNDPSRGLMGVEDPVGSEYAQATGEQLYDPNLNVEAGSGLLSHLKKFYALEHPLGATPLAGWIQMYNTGPTAFLRGERAPQYEAAFLLHRSAFEALAAPIPQP